MKEKEIIKSELYDIRKIRDLIFKIGIGVTLFWFVIYVIPNLIDDIGDGFTSGMFEFVQFHVFVPLMPFVIIGILFYICASKINLVVTNKRVYGTAIFGRVVDLPLDKVSAIGMIGLLKGINVSTSSGSIKFIMIKNVKEIYEAISTLLIDRQEKGKKEEKTTETNRSTTDELREYKKLLDENVISKEEFEKKKKELLNSK